MITAENWKEWMIEPLDFLIIKNLPDEGTNVGLYQIGETTRKLHANLGPDKISVGSLSARVSTLVAVGFARPVNMVGTAGTRAYQKTKLGKEVLETWQQQKQQQRG